MSGQFHKKTSNILVSLIIGIMIIGLVFSFQFQRGGSDTIAKVGHYKITNREFNNEFKRQTEFYGQLFGGNGLTQAQIEQFRVRENALQNLVQRKLMLILGEEVGVRVTPSQIKEKIKALPYFLTDKNFDIDKYKQLLRVNGLTPGQFEEDIKDETLQQTAYKLLNYYPISSGHIKDLHRFKAMELSANIFQIDTNQLVKHIEVSSAEIKTYLKEQINFGRVENFFRERKASLDSPEEVKASHILVKDEKQAKEISAQINKSNFASLAKKYSQDPGSKDKGGELGWFSKGKMTPDFEKAAFQMKTGEISNPIKTNYGYHIIMLEAKKAAVLAKFEDYKEKIAKELIQKQKTDELKALTTELSEKAQSLINSNQTAKLESLAKQYDLTYEQGLTINPIDGLQGSMLLTVENIKAIFDAGLKQDKVYKFEQPNKVIITRIHNSENKSKLKLEEDKQNLQLAFSRKLIQAALKNIESENSVEVYVKL